MEHSTSTTVPFPFLKNLTYTYRVFRQALGHGKDLMPIGTIPTARKPIMVWWIRSNIHDHGRILLLE